MKTTLLAASTLLLLTSVNAAASTVDLTVKGTITPSACTPTLSSGGRVDYGVMPVAELELTGNFYYLPKKNITLSLECNAALLFALSATDNRRASSGPTRGHFGLGTHNDQPIGMYSAKWNAADAEMDGQAVNTLESVDAGTTWMYMPAGALVDTGKVSGHRNGFSASDTSMPSPGTHLNLNMVIDGYVHKALTFDSAVSLDGSLTLDVHYL